MPTEKELNEIANLNKVSLLHRLQWDMKRKTREEREKVLNTILSDFFQTKVSYLEYLEGGTYNE